MKKNYKIFGMNGVNKEKNKTKKIIIQFGMYNPRY